MFAKCDLAELQISLILRQIFIVCKHKFARVLYYCRSQIENNEIEQESAGNSILIASL